MKKITLDIGEGNGLSIEKFSQLQPQCIEVILDKNNGGWERVCCITFGENGTASVKREEEEEGSRHHGYHVLWRDSRGRQHCSEKDCEINKHNKNEKEEG